MTDEDRLAAIRAKYRGLRGDMPPFGDVITLLRIIEAERQAWMDCAEVDPLMEGPRLKGWNRSALNRRWQECIERHAQGEGK